MLKIVIRLPNWIGDIILALPAVESIKKNFPEAEIWLAARNETQDLFIFDEPAPNIIPLGPLGKFKNLRKISEVLKGHSFDIGLLLTNSFASALLFFMAGIPKRWGYHRDGRGLILSKGVFHKENHKNPHQVYYYLDLLEEFGIRTVKPELHLSVSQEAKDAARKELAALGIDLRKPLAIFNPGASYGPAKRWPPSRFADLAGLLQEKKNAEIVITGSPGEEELAEAVSSAMAKKPASLAGKTSLRQLLGLISQASLFITNDSGPMHIANALKIPVVAVFGPTDPSATAPFHPPSTVIKKEVVCWPCLYRKCPYDHRCMNIAPEEVFEACAAYLA